MSRLVILLILLSLILPVPASAQAGGPRILESSTENHFPQQLVFRIVAESEAPIEKITLYYRERGAVSTTRQVLTFEPGQHVEAAYTWDTSQITVPPSTPVLYTWEVRDANGNHIRSEENLVYYHDTRFSWHEHQDADLVVRWYEGDAAFGQQLYQNARQALDRMVQDSGQGLEYPVYLLVYPNQEAFASWHSYVNEWVGGEAYPTLGLTVELIAPGDSPQWVESVIWHEIAHLFFYQAVHAAYADWPHWLDEGVAQYYEPGDHTQRLAQAAAAAKAQRLIPLQALNGSFGPDTEKVSLAYAEALSVVTYMRSNWDEAAFQRLLAGIRSHASFREAIQQAYALRWEEFVAGWMTWMGVPATPAPPPSATPAPVYPTAPMWYTPTPPTPLKSLPKSIPKSIPKPRANGLRSGRARACCSSGWVQPPPRAERGAPLRQTHPPPGGQSRLSDKEIYPAMACNERLFLSILQSPGETPTAFYRGNVFSYNWEKSSDSGGVPHAIQLWSTSMQRTFGLTNHQSIVQVSGVPLARLYKGVNNPEPEHLEADLPMIQTVLRQQAWLREGLPAEE